MVLFFAESKFRFFQKSLLRFARLSNLSKLGGFQGDASLGKPNPASNFIFCFELLICRVKENQFLNPEKQGISQAFSFFFFFESMFKHEKLAEILLCVKRLSNV